MNSNDLLCPICRSAIDLNNFMTDEHGLAVHSHCYMLKKKSFPSDPLAPKKDVQSM